MQRGLSEMVRSVAIERYVAPARRAAKGRFSIPVRDLMRELKNAGFPDRNWPQVCTAIRSEKFLRAHGLVIEAIDGPKSKLSSTVVVHYRIAHREGESKSVTQDPGSQSTRASSAESPEQWADRLTGKLFGLLKDEIAAFGGAEGYLRWVRSEDELQEKEDEDAA